MTNTATERHYDDEALICLMDAERADSDGHVAACAACRDKLEAFRMVADALGDASVWDNGMLDPKPVASTIASLRAFADQMTAEDEHAERYVADLLDGPRETWARTLRHHPEYRTAGVVRKLLAAADRAIDTMPPDAVEITALATDIAGQLDPADYPSDTVARLRGAAWRDHAYALFYTGQYTDAEGAIFTSERHFCDCMVSDYDQARLAIVRALVCGALDQVGRASNTAEEALRAFAAAGDLRRAISIGSVDASLHFRSGNFARALEIWLDLEKQAQDDVPTLARLVPNIAECYRALRQYDRAVEYLTLAAALWQDLGNVAEAARVHMNAALLLVDCGLIDIAVSRLTAVRRELGDAGMAATAAFCDLHIAEAEIARGRFAAAEVAARSAIDAFARSGAGYTARARSATAYLLESIQSRQATAHVARTVRNYVSRLPSEPALLFALPPA